MTPRAWLAWTAVAVLGVTAPVVVRPPERLIWNASESVPVGLYAVRPATRLRPGDIVAVRPPEPLARQLAAAGYLPRGAPLLKPVLALPGQIVCRHGATVLVDGAPVGAARARDGLGRPLPVWQGCRQIPADALFLMNPAHPDSLDGRYFGPLPHRAVLGRAVPLWTDADGDGRFTWLSRAA